MSTKTTFVLNVLKFLCITSLIIYVFKRKQKKNEEKEEKSSKVIRATFSRYFSHEHLLLRSQTKRKQANETQGIFRSCKY